MTERAQALTIGDQLQTGFLFRRIPNWLGRWDPDCGLPGKEAFAPKGIDPVTGTKATGISAYLVDLTNVEQLLEGYDPAFGVVLIDIAEVHRAVTELRRFMGTGRTKVAPFGPFTVTFDPSDDPKDGAARHAHCYIDPVPAAIQKELRRLTSPSRVVKPCGLLRDQ